HRFWNFGFGDELRLNSSDSAETIYTRFSAASRRGHTPRDAAADLGGRGGSPHDKSRKRVDHAIGLAEDKGLQISQWCPNGSTTRPTRQPCWLPTGHTTAAPAETARSNAASGSSRINRSRTVPPPSDSGLKLPWGGDSSASQNSAWPTDKRATTSPFSLSTRNTSRAPNAVL